MKVGSRIWRRAVILTLLAMLAQASIGWLAMLADETLLTHDLLAWLTSHGLRLVKQLVECSHAERWLKKAISHHFYKEC